ATCARQLSLAITVRRPGLHRRGPFSVIITRISSTAKWHICAHPGPQAPTPTIAPVSGFPETSLRFAFLLGDRPGRVTGLKPTDFSSLIAERGSSGHGRCLPQFHYPRNRDGHPSIRYT